MKPTSCCGKGTWPSALRLVRKHPTTIFAWCPVGSGAADDSLSVLAEQTDSARALGAFKTSPTSLGGGHRSLAVSLFESHQGWFINNCGRILNLHNPFRNTRRSPIHGLSRRRAAQGVTIHEIPRGSTTDHLILTDVLDLSEVTKSARYGRALETAWRFHSDHPLSEEVPRSTEPADATYYNSRGLGAGRAQDLHATGVRHAQFGPHREAALWSHAAELVKEYLSTGVRLRGVR